MRVILIDDHIHIHHLVSTLLATTPDIQLIAQGSNGTEALALLRFINPM